MLEQKTRRRWIGGYYIMIVVTLVVTTLWSNVPLEVRSVNAFLVAFIASASIVLVTSLRLFRWRAPWSSSLGLVGSSDGVYDERQIEVRRRAASIALKVLAYTVLGCVTIVVLMPESLRRPAYELARINYGLILLFVCNLHNTVILWVEPDAIPEGDDIVSRRVNDGNSGS